MSTHGQPPTDILPHTERLKCQQCNHEWRPHVKYMPAACPACRSKFWNKPKIPTLKCQRCSHEWKPHADHMPVACPDCHSKSWNKPTAPVINGGKLIFHLKNNYTEIVKYFQENGLEKTLQQYNISEPTLERLIAGGYGTNSEFSKPDRAYHMAEIALAGNAELRREIREMRAEYNQLVQLIAGQITANIIKALQSIEIELPETNKPEIDNLKLTGGLPGMRSESRLGDFAE